jgi:GMP synthase (glutamine-hydrolysing)
MDMFGDHFGLNIVHVEGEQRFLDALKGENDPENVRSSAACSLKCSTKKR